MNNVIQQVSTPYEEGRAALLATGSRTLLDLALDEQTKMRPLIEILRRKLIEQYGLHVIEYSLAGGLETNLLRVQDQRDRSTIESILRTHSLQDLAADANLTSRVIPGLYRLLRAPTENLKWANGKQMRFALVIHFTEHLVPALQNGSATEDMLRVGELIHQLAQSQSLRKSGNFVIFLGREQYIDELVRAPLYTVRLNQPDLEEKKKFLDVALKLYDKATLEQGLTAEDVARLSANTPNSSQEYLLRASHRTGKPVSSVEIQREKVLAVQCISEGTLTPLSSDRVKGIELKGINSIFAFQQVQSVLQSLAKGDETAPLNVCLVGPAAVGKTVMVIMAAVGSAVSALEMHSPKSGIVGETERKSHLQLSLLKEWSPSVGIVDEITELIPTERNEMDNDAGASRAVHGTWLSSLSDESRRGKTMIVGTTNCPWRFSHAFFTRFSFLPVLYPLPEDFPEIVGAIARRIPGAILFKSNEPLIQEAARVFYQKGATPRQIFETFSNAARRKGELNPELILWAAKDLTVSTSLASILYTDFWALKACSQRSFLPWSVDPKSYPYPEHLKGMVDQESGDIITTELNKRIDEYKPFANV